MFLNPLTVISRQPGDQLIERNFKSLNNDLVPANTGLFGNRIEGAGHVTRHPNRNRLNPTIRLERALLADHGNKKIKRIMIHLERLIVHKMTSFMVNQKITTSRLFPESP